jgi:plastocyanin
MKSKIFLGKRIILSSVILFVILSISSNCTKTMDNMYNTGGDKGGSGGPGTNEVWIEGMAFNPSTITISAGTTIKWTNKDNVAHTVTSDNGLFESGNINNSGTFSQTFTTVGTFPYHCTPHPSMTATVIVN